MDVSLCPESKIIYKSSLEFKRPTKGFAEGTGHGAPVLLGGEGRREAHFHDPVSLLLIRPESEALTWVNGMSNIL